MKEFSKFVFDVNYLIMEAPKNLNRLKAVLADASQTNKWLAEQLGKDSVTVSKWCTNTTQPDLHTLARISELLKVNLESYWLTATIGNIMTYDEYLSCAKKHLKGCKSLMDSYQSGKPTDMHVWLELYYISGYILEGLTVYSAYKLYNWPVNEDIKRRYNIPFTNATGIDFYYNRIINGNEIFPGRSVNSLSVQGHRFQDIIKSKLRSNPSFNDLPYIGNGDIDQDVEHLIDNWSPDVRYCYLGQNNPIPILNQDVIIRLIDK